MKNQCLSMIMWRGRDMTDKEVDILIDYIMEDDADIICDKLIETGYCEKFCEAHQWSRECVKEYARVKAEEQANECS